MDYLSALLSRRICSKHFLITSCIWKMMFKVQAIIWYKLEPPTTRTNNSVEAESIFCRFLENEAPKQSKLVKKSFFSKLAGIRFWPVETFLRIFQTHSAYEKFSLGSKETFDITLIEHHMTLRSDYAAAESSFCWFLENQKHIVNLIFYNYLIEWLYQMHIQQKTIHHII